MNKPIGLLLLLLHSIVMAVREKSISGLFDHSFRADGTKGEEGHRMTNGVFVFVYQEQRREGWEAWGRGCERKRRQGLLSPPVKALNSLNAVTPSAGSECDVQRQKL